MNIAVSSLTFLPVVAVEAILCARGIPAADGLEIVGVAEVTLPFATLPLVFVGEVMNILAARCITGGFDFDASAELVCVLVEDVAIMLTGRGELCVAELFVVALPGPMVEGEPP